MANYKGDFVKEIKKSSKNKERISSANDSSKSSGSKPKSTDITSVDKTKKVQSKLRNMPRPRSRSVHEKAQKSGNFQVHLRKEDGDFKSEIVEHS
jgi:hypothetical protein